MGVIWPILKLSTTTSIIGLVVEFVVAIDEARVRFTDDALQFAFFYLFLLLFLVLLTVDLINQRLKFPNEQSKGLNIFQR